MWTSRPAAPAKRAELARDGMRVRVVDEERKAVAGARLVRVPTAQAWFDSAASEVLGVADAAGTVWLPREPAAVARVLVTAHDQELLPRVLDAASLEDGSEVILRRGRECTFRCLAPDGTPVSGVAVGLTLATIAPPNAVELLAGARSPLIAERHLEYPIHCARSSLDGIVRVGPMPEGSFHVLAYHPEWTLVGVAGAGIWESPTVEAPCNARVLDMGPRHGLVLKVTGGDTVLQGATVHTAAYRARGKGWSTADPGLWLARRALVERFPGCLVWCENPGLDQTRAGSGPTVDLRLLLRSGRMVRVCEEMVPLATIRAPKLLDLDAAPGIPMEWGELRVELIDSRGGPVPAHALDVHALDPRDWFGTQQVVPGHTIALPAGDHIVTYGRGGSLEREIGQRRITVAGGRTSVIQVRLSRDYLAIRLQVVDALGAPVDLATARIREATGLFAEVGSVDSNGVAAWVPRGPIRVIVQAPGWQDQETSFDPYAGPSGPEQSCMVVMQRR